MHISNALLKQERVQKINEIELTLDDGLKAVLNVLLVNGSEEELIIDMEGE